MLDPKSGTIYPKTPTDEWQASGIFVSNGGGGNVGQKRGRVEWQVNHRPEAMAASPADVMGSFFDQFLKGPAQLLLLVTALVTVVAAVSILVSIYNSVSARRREIAVLRSLGATRRTILLLICVEAGLIGLVGGLLGWLLGHALAAVAGRGVAGATRRGHQRLGRRLGRAGLPRRRRAAKRVGGAGSRAEGVLDAGGAEPERVSLTARRQRRPGPALTTPPT